MFVSVGVALKVAKSRAALLLATSPSSASASARTLSNENNRPWECRQATRRLTGTQERRRIDIHATRGCASAWTEAGRPPFLSAHREYARCEEQRAARLAEGVRASRCKVHALLLTLALVVMCKSLACSRFRLLDMSAPQSITVSRDTNHVAG